jgi:SAM-dependent methyltransferase
MDEPRERKTHWETIYETRPPDEVSWYQANPELSLRLIKAVTGGDVNQRLLDVGGGASLLTDYLLEAGYRSIGVLDVASGALAQVRERLAAAAESVEWFETDVTSFDSPHRWDVWHDRAVFHFLTDPEDRRRYVTSLLGALDSGGHAIVATFGPDGPPKCSGLDIARYSPEALAEELGPGLRLLETAEELHSTPSGAKQAFVYGVFRR